MAKLTETVSGMTIVVSMADRSSEVMVTVSSPEQGRRKRPTSVDVQAYFDAGMTEEEILARAMHLASTSVRFTQERQASELKENGATHDE